MSAQKLMLSAFVTAVVSSVALCLAKSPSSQPEAPKPVRIGAVASSPSTVTVFKGIRKYLRANGLPADYVLYSSYDALVGALERGEVDIAWNTPMAHGRYHVRNGCASQTLVMRDVDRNIRAVLVVRADSGIDSVDDLKGKTLVLGSNESAEATVLPLHYLQEQRGHLAKVNILSLDGEVDGKGNPCSSPRHVLQAVRDGRGDAGVITERLWNSIRSRRGNGAAGLKKIWSSPSFSHCVFTAAEELDPALGKRFTELMVAMPADDPATADILRLEGAKKWVVGSPEGFVDLVEALQKRAPGGQGAE